MLQRRRDVREIPASRYILAYATRIREQNVELVVRSTSDIRKIKKMNESQGPSQSRCLRPGSVFFSRQKTPRAASFQEKDHEVPIPLAPIFRERAACGSGRGRARVGWSPLLSNLDDLLSTRNRISLSAHHLLCAPYLLCATHNLSGGARYRDDHALRAVRAAQADYGELRLSGAGR
jgi:hypothetical protein